MNPAYPSLHMYALSATHYYSPQQFLGGGLFLQSQEKCTTEKGLIVLGGLEIFFDTSRN